MSRLFCLASFSSLCFRGSRGSSFNHPLIICRRRTHVLLFLFWRYRFFRVFFVPFPLSLCMETTSYVLSSRKVFFYLVTTGWSFDISLCKNSIQFNSTQFNSIQFNSVQFNSIQYSSQGFSYDGQHKSAHISFNPQITSK